MDWSLLLSTFIVSKAMLCKYGKWVNEFADKSNVIKFAKPLKQPLQNVLIRFPLKRICQIYVHDDKLGKVYICAQWNFTEVNLCGIESIVTYIAPPM